MSTHQQVYSTVACDGPDCPHTVTFENSQEAQVRNEVPWFKTLRVIQTTQGRKFVYCSDVCEIAGVGAGAHNPEEPKAIVLPQGANAAEVAAAQAKAAEEATKALKSGKGSVQVTKA
jgi:hypothetical protein